MHTDIARLANEAFYHGRLRAVGLQHQIDVEKGYSRTVFYPSKREAVSGQIKINHDEAAMAARLAGEIYNRELNQEGFDAAHTLGIITPYRSQIALIRKEIAKLGIEALNELAIETV